MSQPWSCRHTTRWWWPGATSSQIYWQESTWAPPWPWWRFPNCWLLHGNHSWLQNGGCWARCYARPSASRSHQSHAWRHYPVSHRPDSGKVEADKKGTTWTWYHRIIFLMLQLLLIVSAPGAKRSLPAWDHLEKAHGTPSRKRMASWRKVTGSVGERLLDQLNFFSLCCGRSRSKARSWQWEKR